MAGGDSGGSTGVGGCWQRSEEKGTHCPVLYVLELDIYHYTMFFVDGEIDEMACLEFTNFKADVRSPLPLAQTRADESRQTSSNEGKNPRYAFVLTMVSEERIRFLMTLDEGVEVALGFYYT